MVAYDTHGISLRAKHARVNRIVAQELQPTGREILDFNAIRDDYLRAKASKIMADSKQQAQIFKALSDETRLKILLMLNTRPRSVGEIVDFFSLSQPTISRHLLLLKQAGLLISKRRGQQVIYALNEEGLREDALGYFRGFECLKGIIGAAVSKKK